MKTKGRNPHYLSYGHLIWKENKIPEEKKRQMKGYWIAASLLTRMETKATRVRKVETSEENLLSPLHL